MWMYCVVKASRDKQENVSQVFRGLTGIQEFQELDSLGLPDLRVS